MSQENGKAVKIKPCRLIIDSEYEYSGASPDDVIDGIEDGKKSIAEVKCLERIKNFHPEVAFNSKIGTISTMFDKKIPLKLIKTMTFFQIQGQLHITNADICYFAVWSPHSIKYTKVSRHDNFWVERMEPYLTQFCEEALFPEIIDSRLNRSREPRVPAYVEQLKNQKLLSKIPAGFRKKIVWKIVQDENNENQEKEIDVLKIKLKKVSELIAIKPRKSKTQRSKPKIKSVEILIPGPKQSLPAPTLADIEIL